MYVPGANKPSSDFPQQPINSLLDFIHNDRQDVKTNIALLPGETAIQNAPVHTLKPNTSCIPQHYLQFAHTLESVENILLDIDYSDKYPVFACTDPGGIYIQIGIIGFDNYRPVKKQTGAKIVYGRKWRVEPQLPTSEIIQTVFLALQKAREHEIRELLRLQFKGQISTPFNNHHDIPLMANIAQQLINSDDCKISLQCDKWISLLLEDITYDRASFSLSRLEKRPNGQYLIDLRIEPTSQTQLPELGSTEITLLLEQLSCNQLYHELMSKLVQISNRYVEEHFTYRNYARFSRENNVKAIAELSCQTRNRTTSRQQETFDTLLRQTNYHTDQSRVPKLSIGALSNKIQQQLKRQNIVDGILPSLG
jgi:hypothetical protein